MGCSQVAGFLLGVANAWRPPGESGTPTPGNPGAGAVDHPAVGAYFTSTKSPVALTAGVVEVPAKE
jgi:hypothetical protein